MSCLVAKPKNSSEEVPQTVQHINPDWSGYLDFDSDTAAGLVPFNSPLPLLLIIFRSYFNFLIKRDVYNQELSAISSKELYLNITNSILLDVCNVSKKLLNPYSSIKLLNYSFVFDTWQYPFYVPQISSSTYLQEDFCAFRIHNLKMTCKYDGLIAFHYKFHSLEALQGYLSFKILEFARR